MRTRHSSVVACALGTALAAGVVGGRAQSPSFNLNEASIDALQQALAARQITCRAVVEHYLGRIDAYDKRGPALNAIVSLHPRALAEADRLDAARRGSGSTGPLHCVPVLVKDAFDTSEMPTTYGSAAFKTFTPAEDATVVAKLKRAGALVLAKATLGEFASGYAGSISGPIRNPYDLRRHPSGSSGGTGAGITADFATVGIGGDTGGSVRGPASAGSLVGLRPTTALVSRHGSVPFKPSYDSAGPITRSVRDAALVMDVITGYDAKDPLTVYTVGRVPPSFARALSADALKGARIGVVRQPMQQETDANSPEHRQIRAVFGRAVDDLQRLGATAVDVILPNVATRTRAGYEENVFETEAAVDAFLAQHPNAPIKSLKSLVLTRGALLPWRAKALMNTIGRSTDEPAYGRVLRSMEDARFMVLSLMADEKLDALVYPSGDHYPGLIAPDIATNPDLVGDTRLGSNRTLASVIGFPAVSVPSGFTDDRMPVGLEFMGRAFEDAKILSYAYAYERATKHRRPPSTTPPLTRP